MCYNKDMKRKGGFKTGFSSGFTLIELALSSAFVGILSIAIVLIINETVAAYRRGITLNQVTTTGMDIVDDLRTAVQNSSARSVANDCIVFYADASAVREACQADGGYNFVSITKTADVTLNKGGGRTEVRRDMPIYGAFCTGTYSYIWNSGYFEANEADFAEKRAQEWATLTYLPSAGADPVTIFGTDRSGTEEKFSLSLDSRPFRLLKVRDNYRAVCSSVVRYDVAGGEFKNNYALPSNENLSNNFNISGYGVLTEEPVDLILADYENDLVLYDLDVARPAESTTRQNTFYSVSFILGTTDGGIDVMSSGQSCAPPADWEKEDFDYCAINKFNFAVQANGER